MKNQSEKSRRAKIAYAFECAKQYLWNGSCSDLSVGKFEFICNALSRARLTGEITDDVYHNAIHVLTSRLDQSRTLSGWLRGKGVDSQDNVRLQAHRLAWLNLLIKEFQGPAK